MAAIISVQPRTNPRNPIGGSYVTSKAQATVVAATRAVSAMTVVRSKVTDLGPQGCSVCS